MLMILASTEALREIRARGRGLRGSVRAKAHPDGGVWVAARGRDGERLLLELAERYGTRVWRGAGWVTLKPQLKLPGF